MNVRAITLLPFLIAGAAHAQPATDSLRAFYIQEYPDRFGFWPVLKQRKLFFSLRDFDRAGKRVSYYPNNAFTFGFGAYLFDVVLEATFAIPLSEKRNEIYGESLVSDLQANILAKKFAADLYYQRHEGFYADDSRYSIPPGIPFPQRPDIRTRNFGLGGLYVLNHRKFSLRSAFNYVDRQLHSMGSVIVGGSLNSFKVKADSAVLKIPSKVDLGNGSDFEMLGSTMLSMSAGYSYTYIRKNLFVNGTLAIGPAHHWINYEENGSSRYDVTINGISTWRFGIGYNSDRFFGGIGYVAQSRSIIFGDIRFTNTTSMLRIVVGYRFYKTGILKKRAIDFIYGSS